MRISKYPVPLLAIVLLILLMGCDVLFSDLARKIRLLTLNNMLGNIAQEPVLVTIP